MIRDILTNKWCIGGTGFLILFCIGCYLWFQHETISYRKQAEESDEILRRWKMSQNKQDSVPVKKQSDTVDNETFQEKRISVSQEMEVNPNIMSKKTSEVPLKLHWKQMKLIPLKRCQFLALVLVHIQKHLKG